MNKITNKDYSLHREVTACAGQWLYQLGDDGVVYSETRNRFVGLDAAGVSAYRAFNAGVSIQDLRGVNDVRNSFSASSDRLEAIHALSEGIFPSEGGEDIQEQWPALDQSVTANVEIHGIPVFLEYPAGRLEHLCRDSFRNCPAIAQPGQCHLRAQHTEGGWSIYANGRELLSSLRDEQVGLGLLHAARSLLYAEAEYDVAFHASMVADRDCGVMLCAPRESGKSTLAAYLVAHGFEFVTDEPALLHLETSSVSSLCLPVSLKEGSWEILEHEWPQLFSAPVHVRSDGTKIRLLHPSPRLSAQPRGLMHIVFPQYQSSSVAYAERLSPLHTLNLLNDGGMILARHLAQDTFEAFLSLVCNTPAYVLRYGSLREGGRMIAELTELS